MMGERAPEEWAGEFERAGRVVFPVRRRPLLIQLLIVLALISGSQINSLIEMQSAGSGERIFRLFNLALFLLGIGVIVWQLVTRRPTLVVDREGIRYGKRRFMPWSEVGTIGLVTGPKFFMNVPVLPANVWAKDVRLPQYNVRDIPALATWLTAVLKQHRANERATDGQSALD